MMLLIDLERTIGTGSVHYWNQNKHGYTRDPMAAGRFDPIVAADIVLHDIDSLTFMIPEDKVKDVLRIK